MSHSSLAGLKLTAEMITRDVTSHVFFHLDLDSLCNKNLLWVSLLDESAKMDARYPDVDVGWCWELVLLVLLAGQSWR